MTDARGEGELGVSAAGRREGGKVGEREVRLRFYSLEEDFMEDGRGRKEAWVLRLRACRLLCPFQGVVLGQLLACPAVDALQGDSGLGKVLGHFGIEGHTIRAEHSWPAEHLFSA